MRILFVAEAFGGGTFEVTRMQAEGLARRGYDVAIAYGQRPETPRDPRAVVDETVDLIALPWSRRSIGAQMRAQRALRALFTDWRPDVVHLSSSFAGLHGVLAAKDIPTVYTPHAYAFTMVSEPAYKRLLYLAVESFVKSRVDVVGACSLSEGEQARSLPGSASVVVVPNGIDELNDNGCRPVAASEREFPVVALGRSLPQRQPEACLRIMTAVGDLREMRWIGGGCGNSPGAQALRQAGIPMTGWMPRAETLRTLGRSIVYLHWTAWDGLSLSVLEAMALDVIVVASDIGPNREVLGADQVCRTEEQAVALIRSVLNEPDVRESLLTNQRERRKSYGADAMVAGWSDIYSVLAGADRAGNSGRA